MGDVLYYYGDQAPNFVKPKHVDPSLGFGYDYDVTNSEVILKRLDVLDGRLVLPDGQSYELLVLPDQDHANLEVLKKLEELLNKGATIVGPKPSRSHGLKDYAERDKGVRELADKIWGSCDGVTVLESRYGLGKVIWGKSLKQILLDRGIGPDFNYISNSDSTSLDFIHRRSDGEEIYFVSNTRNEVEVFDGIFRTSGKLPEIWNPETGTTQKMALYDIQDESTRIQLKLEPHGSLFVVFREKAKQHIVSIDFEKNTIRPEVYTGMQASGSEISGMVSEEGLYTFTRDDGKTEVLEVNDIPPSFEITGPWSIDFPSDWGAPDQATFPELMSWTDSDQEGIRYFSGIATYNKEFDIHQDYIDDDLVVLLDLGRVKEVAEVYLNGENLQILWKAPYQLDISRAILPGKNSLRIEVANTWSNRLTGDGRHPEGKQYTKTNITGPNYLNRILWKDAPLLESGLMGPVSIHFAKKIRINELSLDQ